MIEYTKEHPLRVLTLFSGYDAQLIALKRLKRDFPDFDFTCAAWSDIDKYAIRAHNALFPDLNDKNLGDVCTIDWAQVPDFDLLTYSFPCTSISLIGRQKGLTEGSGTASSLLWECKRAIIAKHPRYLIMENVAALLSEKFRSEFLKWTSFLESEGYSNFTKVLNAKNYGVAQNRERVFCVSIRDIDAHFYFPEPFPLTKRLKDYLEDDVDESYYLDEDRVRDVISPMLAEDRVDDKLFFNVKRGGIGNDNVTLRERERSGHLQIIRDGDFCDRFPPDVKYLGNMLELEGRAKRRMPSPYRIYGKDGISPTIVASTGGALQPFIIDKYNGDDGIRDNP